ncbi:MAG: cupin domain-containing protein [Alphaproteobacteria bacterium]|nr:cupin domain-containing protein [Alphaproteobacteria bacterium]NNF23515.1 cupin domain-containing protein [Paracoccaceae bacterium]
MDVGRRLQEARKKCGFSQRELAARAGLTNGAISLIEKNKTSPSIASLKSLLDAVGMNMSDFFSDLEDSQQQKYFFTAAEFTQIAPQLGMQAEDGLARISFRQLGSTAGNALQVLHEKYPPNSDTGPELISHDGEEAGVVVDGRIEITVGEQVRELTKGDGYHFDSRLPHRFRNTSDMSCEIVSACTPPTF